MNKDLKQKIEKRWLDRAEAQGLKPGSMKYRRGELEFFAGAMSALDAAFPNENDPKLLSSSVPVIWWVNAISGRPIAEQEKS